MNDLFDSNFNFKDMKWLPTSDKFGSKSAIINLGDLVHFQSLSSTVEYNMSSSLYFYDCGYFDQHLSAVLDNVKSMHHTSKSSKTGCQFLTVHEAIQHLNDITKIQFTIQNILEKCESHGVVQNKQNRPCESKIEVLNKSPIRVGSSELSRLISPDALLGAALTQLMIGANVENDLNCSSTEANMHLIVPTLLSLSGRRSVESAATNYTPSVLRLQSMHSSASALAAYFLGCEGSADLLVAADGQLRLLVLEVDSGYVCASVVQIDSALLATLTEVHEPNLSTSEEQKCNVKDCISSDSLSSTASGVAATCTMNDINEEKRDAECSVNEGLKARSAQMTLQSYCGTWRRGVKVTGTEYVDVDANRKTHNEKCDSWPSTPTGAEAEEQASDVAASDGSDGLESSLLQCIQGIVAKQSCLLSRSNSASADPSEEQEEQRLVHRVLVWCAQQVSHVERDLVRRVALSEAKVLLRSDQHTLRGEDSLASHDNEDQCSDVRSSAFVQLPVDAVQVGARCLVQASQAPPLQAPQEEVSNALMEVPKVSATRFSPPLTVYEGCAVVNNNPVAVTILRRSSPVSSTTSGGCCIPGTDFVFQNIVWVLGDPVSGGVSGIDGQRMLHNARRSCVDLQLGAVSSSSSGSSGSNRSGDGQQTGYIEVHSVGSCAGKVLLGTIELPAECLSSAGDSICGGNGNKEWVLAVVSVIAPGSDMSSGNNTGSLSVLAMQALPESYSFPTTLLSISLCNSEAVLSLTVSPPLAERRSRSKSLSELLKKSKSSRRSAPQGDATRNAQERAFASELWRNLRSLGAIVVALLYVWALCWLLGGGDLQRAGALVKWPQNSSSASVYLRLFGQWQQSSRQDGSCSSGLSWDSGFLSSLLSHQNET